MAYTRAQWNALQNSLPEEDRTSYEDYLAAVNVVTTVAKAGGNVVDAVVSSPAPAVTTTPSTVAARESGIIGAASIAAQQAPAPAPAPTPTPSPKPAPSPIDAQDVRDPVTGLTPAQVAAQKAIEEIQVIASQAGLKTELRTPTGQAGTITVLPSEPAPQNFTGDGTQTRPLLLNGEKFTGNRNGIEYKNGLPVDATRADILQANREAEAKAQAEARAKSNPLFNPTVRPQGAIDNGFIVYWSWIGGVNTGQWEQYRAPVTPDNLQKYGSRVFSGETQGSFTDAVGANALKNQPMLRYNQDGSIAGYQLGNQVFTTQGFQTAPATTGAVTGAVTGGAVTSGATTGAVTGGATTGIITGGTTTLPFTGTFSTTTLPFTGGFTTVPLTATATGATTTGMVTTPPTTTPTTTGPVFDINRQSAVRSLQDRFAKYGLSSLANKILELARDGATEATITLQLQETPEYQMRFRANQERLKKGLTVLTPAEYLNLEDSYRQIIRAYGLRQFDTDDYVQQFISNDVSPAELSQRVVTAVQRVQNADPQIARTLRDYYGIGQNDLVAYVLDPQQQFQKIERQVAAAEIGTAARLQGIEAGVGTAEALAAQGITQAEARRGYSTIADILPTAEKLSQIYGGTEKAYGLAEAEQEVFNSLAEAQRRRQRLASREMAQFGGTSGMSRVSLTEPTRGQF